MLKANVGISRKISRDYNSTGFSVNLEGEIGFDISESEAVIEKIKEFYDVADEALALQIDRYERESAVANRELGNCGSNTSVAPRLAADNPKSTSSNAGFTQGNQGGNGSEQATNKQVQYLLNLGKRRGLTPKQLDSRISERVGQAIGVYGLSKRQAGDLIDLLSQEQQSPPAATNGRGVAVN